MKANPVLDSQLLKQVEEAFSKHLSENGGQRRHWSEALQRLAAQAVDAGHTPGAVAKAAGVYRGSVVNWCKNERSRDQNLNEPAPTPVELKVVESRDREKSEKVNESNPAVARILFLSGAILECPVSALTAEILSKLNEARR